MTQPRDPTHTDTHHRHTHHHARHHRGGAAAVLPEVRLSVPRVYGGVVIRLSHRAEQNVVFHHVTAPEGVVEVDLMSDEISRSKETRQVHVYAHVEHGRQVRHNNTLAARVVLTSIIMVMFIRLNDNQSQSLEHVDLGPAGELGGPGPWSVLATTGSGVTVGHGSAHDSGARVRRKKEIQDGTLLPQNNRTCNTTHGLTQRRTRDRGELKNTFRATSVLAEMLRKSAAVCLPGGLATAQGRFKR
jgi:hypothetical protein